MSKFAGDVKKVLGYGEKIAVLLSNGEEKEFHFRPVPIKKLHEAQELVAKFVELTGNEGDEDDNNIVWSKEAFTIAIKLTKLCLESAHNDITEDFIEKNFTLGVLGASVRTILDMNGFLEQMTMLQQAMGELTAKKMA